MSDTSQNQIIRQKLDQAFPQLRQCLEQLVKKLNPSRIILFGSYATGHEKPDSDLDILVTIDYSFTPQSTRMSAIREVRNILRPLHCPKDVLVFSEEEVHEWEDYPNHIIGKAFEEGWTLYEQ